MKSESLGKLNRIESLNVRICGGNRIFVRKGVPNYRSFQGNRKTTQKDSAERSLRIVYQLIRLDNRTSANLCCYCCCYAEVVVLRVPGQSWAGRSGPQSWCPRAPWTRRRIENCGGPRSVRCTR